MNCDCAVIVPQVHWPKFDGTGGSSGFATGGSWIVWLTAGGEKLQPLDPLYVAHDMIHVITGIAPTGEGEIALGGFQVAMDDNPANSFAFLSPLIVHEAGFAGVDVISRTEGTLARPYAAELLGREMARGAATTGEIGRAHRLNSSHRT